MSYLKVIMKIKIKIDVLLLFLCFFLGKIEFPEEFSNMFIAFN